MPSRPDWPESRFLRRRLGRFLHARIVGQKKAREIWFLCRQYDQNRRWIWALSTPWYRWRIWKRNRPLVPRNAAKQPDGAALLKAALNADCDGQAGLQELAGTPPCCST